MTITITPAERLKLYKTADEQIRTRIKNGAKKPKAIRQTFKTLDIQALCPDYTRAKRNQAANIINGIPAACKDVLAKIRLQKKIVDIKKMDKTLETWLVSDDHGKAEELNILAKEYKNKKGK